jgi:capsular polysaccharide export protein
VSFRKERAAVNQFYQELYVSVGITDVVLFGDRRSIHRPAIELARSQGIRVHVFEEGYFRPHWATLERDGVNAHSPLPRDPAWYLQAGQLLQQVEPAHPFSSQTRARATCVAGYYAACLLNPLLFSGYHSHIPIHPFAMAAGYLRRYAQMCRYEADSKATIAQLLASGSPFYLLPLQLNIDAQIRDHSDFEHMEEVMSYVVESFARHAPRDSRLVIKNHPLDMGLVPYRSILDRLERQFACSGRIEYLEDGDLNTLVTHARGTVTVNSTVGSVALKHHCPTIALNNPIYNLPGLTFQGELDQFWTAAEPPDPALFSSFEKVVIQTSQINGGFYCSDGSALAVENATKRLTSEQSPLQELASRVTNA